MFDRGRVIRAAATALLVIVLSASSTLAHNGEDHSQGGGPDAGSILLGVASVVMVGALVIGILRSMQAQSPDPEFDDPARPAEE